jgi:hypothetical protein
MPRPKLEALLEQAIHLAVRAQRDHPIASRVTAHDIERVDPDGTGRAEDRELLHTDPGNHQGCVTSQTRATSGSVDVRLSIRSSTPP